MYKLLKNLIEMDDYALQKFSVTSGGTVVYLHIEHLKASDSTQNTSILPNGYTQVDYIGSSGTQYINTEFTPNQNTSVEIKAIKNSNSFLFGSRTSLSSNSYGIAILSDTDFRSDYGTENLNISNQILTSPFVILKQKNKIYFDDTLVGTNISQTFTSPGNMYLFGINTNGTGAFGSHRIYYCKIYDNDTLVRDMIPCYRNSDNEIGLYDLVNNVFYTNAGTGTFTYGSVVNIPNPSYPQDIHVVTGNNTIIISNSDNTKSQIYQLTLGNLEMCKIITYADEFFKNIPECEYYDNTLQEGKWYKYAKIGKVVLDGSESYENMDNTNKRTTIYITVNDIENYMDTHTTPNLLSSHFKAISQSDTWIPGYISRVTRNSRLIFIVEPNTTVAEFKAWLRTHNTIVYYVLATPTKTLLSDTLQIQLDNFYNNAYEYEDGTYITQTNTDRPFIIEID